jgi:hypothetical protein
MKVRFLLVLGTLVGIVGVLGFTVTPAHATSSPIQSLGISPLRSELTISPGTAFDGAITLTNIGKSPVFITMDAEVFSVTDEQYDYSFDPSGTGANWVSFSQNSVTLPASGAATIYYKVSVPITAEPGGRYLSLFATSSPAANSSGVSSINRVASLLYITVAGDVTRTGKVLTFNSPVLTSGDATWTATLQNSGTTHFHSIYNVVVRPLFGNSFSSSEADSLILPSTVRFISQPIPHLDWIGIYRLDYTIGLGDVPAQKETRLILNVPPLQGLILLVLIATIVLVKLKPSSYRKKQQD